MIRILMIALALVVPATATAQPAFNRYANDFIARARAEGDLGGGLVLVRPNGTIERDFGLADSERGQRADRDTIYHWASITKTFTAVALMQLVQRGLVDLDAPVVNYIPEFRAVRNRFGRVEDITVRHVLHHTSGLRDPTWPWLADGARDAPSWRPQNPPNWQQLVAMMPYTATAYAPGSSYSYSNLGSILLAVIVERISGDDIRAYVDKNILRPLGMTRTYYDLTPYHLQASRSNSYVIRSGRPVAEGREFDTGITTGNGGLNAPLGDMALWLRFLMGVGDTALYEQILPRPILESLWEPGYPTGYDPNVDERMASHFFVMDHRGADGRTRRFIGHTGSQNGFRSFFYIDPRSRTGLIAVVNTTNPDARRTLIFGMRQRAFERLFPALERAR